MSDQLVEKIEIQKEFGFPELRKRMRKVQLKGFPDVCVYEGSDFDLVRLNPEGIRKQISTPQPATYRDHLNRIGEMAKLFSEKGIDIFNLNGGVDYIAFKPGDSEGTLWTVIPPVVESFYMNAGTFHDHYESMMDSRLNSELKSKGLAVNPELKNLKKDRAETVRLINDGSHRVHYAVDTGISQTLLVASGIKEGWPYYAAPQSYELVDILPTRPEDGGAGKIHVVTSPGHKMLYRLFPSGGINSGTVRPDKKATL
ncbi:MAG: hypothetical protein ABIH72_02200 [archaeon]